MPEQLQLSRNETLARQTSEHLEFETLSHHHPHTPLQGTIDPESRTMHSSDV